MEVNVKQRHEQRRKELGLDQRRDKVIDDSSSGDEESDNSFLPPCKTLM